MNKFYLTIVFPNQSLAEMIHFYRFFYYFIMRTPEQAALAQLGERQTEDLKAPCSIHGGGIFFIDVTYFIQIFVYLKYMLTYKNMQSAGCLSAA